MKHIAIFPLIVGIIILVGAQGANAQETSVSVDSQGAIGAKDLEVSEPAILPSSPFYFLKNWSRRIQKTFTFNPVKKLELELRFADEKAVEAQKLAKSEFSNVNAIERAIENYNTSQSELKKRLEALKETSKNTRVDSLLEKFVDRAVKHDRLFANLKGKFDNKAGVKAKIEFASKAIEESFMESAKKDDGEKFSKKLEKALDKVQGNDFKHIGSLEFIDRLDDKMDDKIKENLVRVRYKFSERLKEDVEKFTEEHKDEAAEGIREALEKLPGDNVRHLVILEELESRVAKPIREVLKETGQTLEKRVELKGNMREIAEHSIRETKELVQKLEDKVKIIPSLAPAIKNLSREARMKLDRAISAMSEERYGEAFGQARSAFVTAKNALGIFEKEREEAEEEEIEKSSKGDTLRYEAVLEKKFTEFENIMFNLSARAQEKVKTLIADARHHLIEAKETFADGKIEEGKEHIKDAREIKDEIEYFFKEEKKDSLDKHSAKVCTQEYDPVCGVDEKIYSNTCQAEVAGTAVKYRGECVMKNKDNGHVRYIGPPIKEEINKQGEARKREGGGLYQYDYETMKKLKKDKSSTPDVEL